MTENHNNYWQKRAEQRLIESEDKAKRLEKSFKREFNKAYKNIEAEIAKLYFTFADENGLDYGKCTQQLTKTQKEQFRNDMEYYIKSTKDNTYKKNLEALCIRKRVNNLEARKYAIEAEVHRLYIDYLGDEMQLTLNDVFDYNYYNSIFDMQQFIGIGVSFTKVSPEIMDTLLEYPWSGKNYSQKLWGHVNNFSGKLGEILTAGIIQGKSNQEMSRQLAKIAGVEYKKAEMLIRTETNFIANQATAKSYENYGVEQYQYLATLDMRTSDMCIEMDKQVFTLEDRKVGINYPPLHPRCRSTTIPYFEDLDGTRIARNRDGTTYKVDRNMSYKDWHKKYVGNN